MRTDLAWAALQWPSMEHVIVEATGDGFGARSTLVLAEEGLASVRYELTCDRNWNLIRLSVELDSATGRRSLELTADAAGHWQADGSDRADLDGCTDVDISQTPLTNTLPIRRLDWQAANSYDLDVVYVAVPALSLRRVRQRYTLLSPAGQRDRVYRYQSGTFSADLPADADGFITDYPGLWRRVAPLPGSGISG
jgi:hypothetical protein